MFYLLKNTYKCKILHNIACELKFNFLEKKLLFLTLEMNKLIKN